MASRRGVIKIHGKTHYLWRAVDQDGTVLDILVTSRRDAKATRFSRKLLTGVRFVPRVLVTDKLASYGVAHRRLMCSVEHRRSKYLNNKAENSHQFARQRERAMKRFHSAVAPSASCPASAAYHRTSDPAATDSLPPSTNTK
jgi:putative transposase